MTVRIIFEFKDNQSVVDAGWLETWYMDGTDPFGALDAWTTETAVRAVRGRLSSDYVLSRIATVVIGDRSKTADKTFTAAQGQGTYPVIAGQPSKGEQPWDAVKILCYSSGKAALLRNFALRGIPEGAIKNTTNYDPDPTFRDALNLWIRVATQTPLFLVRKRGLILGPNPTSMAVGADLRSLVLTYTVPPPAAFVPKSLILLSGVLAAGPVNHIWRIRTVSDTTITTYPQRRVIWGTPNITGMVLNRVVFGPPPDTNPGGFIPVAQMIPQRGTKRNTGRPRLQLRGRARAR